MRGLTAAGGTVVSVLHEIGFALHADHLVVLQAGRVLHAGAPHDPATHAALEAVFDGRIAIRPLDDGWAVVPRA